MQIGKETNKILLFADNMIPYLKHPKNSTPKLFDTINNYSKVAGYKINIAIKEMQIKTTLRFYLTPVRIAIISNTNNNRCW
jgi:hypothetical protein